MCVCAWKSRAFETARKRESELAKLRQDLEAANVQHEASAAQMRKKHQDAVNDMGEQIEQLQRAKAAAEKAKQQVRQEVEEAKAQAEAASGAKAAVEKLVRQLEQQLEEMSHKVCSFVCLLVCLFSVTAERFCIYRNALSEK